MTADLFADQTPSWQEPICPGATVLRGLALAEAPAILSAIEDITRRAPFRQMDTPGGFRMSVAMSNCGPLGWVSDRQGYRYAAWDPATGEGWPEMPEGLRALARHTAASAGFAGFAPDACLINRYAAGARMSLHQDRDEQDLRAPIVSISLGLPALFLFGGPTRKDPARRIPLTHGDVVVWGGPARLHFHGVAPLKAGEHPATGPFRINLTLRQAN